jgi:tetratricopeptide (TPR) repeat protein
MKGIARYMIIWLLSIGLLGGLTGAKAENLPQSGSPEKSESAPGQLGTGEVSDWQARWELARMLSYMKKYDESLMEYEKLLQEKPDLLEAKAEAASVMSWKGQPQKALEILEQIPLEKMNDQTRLVLADLYRSEKKYKEAEKLYRSYLEKHPEDLKIRLNLAELLSWNKRYHESLGQYEIILQARPDDLQIRRKYAQVLSWAGRKAEAAAELRKTLGR